MKLPSEATFQDLTELTIPERMKLKLMSNIRFMDTDGYKISHWLQDPDSITDNVSYIEARKSEEEIVVYGIQYLLESFVCPTLQEVKIAKFYFDNYYAGKGHFNYEGWKQVAELGYLPLSVSAVPEGTVVPSKNVVMTVRPTLPGFTWLVGWYEAQSLRVWYPMTVASQSRKIRQTIEKWLTKNGTPELIRFKFVDFGARGCNVPEAAGVGGSANNLFFTASDTIKGALFAFDMYGADPEGLSGTIGASEHSTTSIWCRKGEKTFLNRMIEVFGQEGAVFANVMDTYDDRQAMRYVKELEPKLIASGATMYMRLDSGDPVQHPVEMTLEALDLFGYSVNDKGYKVLPNHVRLLQGDGVTAESIDAILQKLDELKISADNISFGMGGKLLQAMSRDTLGFAMKRSWAVVDGIEVDVYKDPITDPGKRSKRGDLTLVMTAGEYVTKRVSEVTDEDFVVLREVWRNGKFIEYAQFQNMIETLEASMDGPTSEETMRVAMAKTIAANDVDGESETMVA